MARSTTSIRSQPRRKRTGRRRWPEGDFVAQYPLSGRVLVRCFQYDPARGRVTIDWGFPLLMLPAGFTLVATLGIFAAARRRRLDAAQGSPG